MKSVLCLSSFGVLALVFGCGLERGGSSKTPVLDDQDMSFNGAADASDRDGSTDETPPDLRDAGAPDSASSILPIGDDPRDVVLGHYAERRAFRTIQQVTSQLFTNDVNVLTTSYSLVEIERVGTRYVFRENACRVMIENEGPFVSLDVTIADEVPQSIPQIESELLIEATRGAITWVRPTTSAPVGFIPKTANDVLPSSATDPRVKDSDGDGNPGVTAHVIANLGLFGMVEGNLYLTQWNRARYAGTRSRDGKLEGENFDTSEQNVIGSDNMMLANNNPNIVPDENTADNRIVLVPLDAPITCTTLLGRVSSLFP